MKLIDLLVQETKKGNFEWPEGVSYVEQYVDLTLFSGCEWSGHRKFERADDYADGEVTREQYEAALAVDCISWCGGECPVDGDVVVEVKFRAQGQADLDGDVADNFRWEHFGNGADVVAYRLHKSAHQQPQWNGEGLPPVGCRVEALSGDKWVEATVAYTDRPEGHGGATVWKEALVFDCKTTKPFWADEFRPIRSEADKKRYAACDSMHKWWREVAGQQREDGSLIDIYSCIYDAIAAGKIPGIRIE